MLNAIAPSALLLSGVLMVVPTAASAVTYGLCAPDDNFFASSCVGTLASNAMLVRNDLLGFFLGRRPTYTEDSVLSGVGDTRLRAYGAPDWNRISEVWATQGVGLTTQLSYPALAGRDPLLAEATAKALLSTASIDVSTRNHGTGHAPTNGYATQATSYARLAEVITVTSSPFASSVSARFTMQVTGSIDEVGPAMGSFAYASARLHVSTMARGSASGGVTDLADFLDEGAASDLLSAVATATRPSDIPLGTPFTADFRLAGQLTTGVVNSQYAYAIDFGRTATFGIDVPPDASWSSHSGVFLSQPIPEPSSSALLAVGVTLLGSVHGLRRRRAPVAAADALIGQ